MDGRMIFFFSSSRRLEAQIANGKDNVSHYWGSVENRLNPLVIQHQAWDDSALQLQLVALRLSHVK
jgi:hypothetical protein